MTSGDVGLSAAVDAAREARPGEPVSYVVPPGDEGPTYQVATVDDAGDFHVVMVDPGSGEVTTADHHHAGWLELTERLHFNLNSTEILGVNATAILGWLGVLWLVILLSGFYVWYWPRIRKWVHLVSRPTQTRPLHVQPRSPQRGRHDHPDPHAPRRADRHHFVFPNEVARHLLRPDVRRLRGTRRAGGDVGGVERHADHRRRGGTVVAELDDAVEPYFVATPSGSPVAVYTVYAYVDPSFLGMLAGEHEVEFSVDQYSGRIVKVEDVLDNNGPPGVRELGVPGACGDLRRGHHPRALGPPRSVAARLGVDRIPDVVDPPPPTRRAAPLQSSRPEPELELTS